MGGGSYSIDDRKVRAVASGFYTNSVTETFSQRKINNAMDPHGVKMRESRDSKEHPNTVPIIIALDVTGSMGSVPAYLVKDGLPNIVANIIQRGIKDPQLLFLAVGDHECDNSPLQVGQFESSDELLDHWLTNVWLEGGGGGNDGESYLLAWYFAALHTSTDSFEKRNKKGFLFTIGDEPVLKRISGNTIKGITGEGQSVDYVASDLLNKAREKYNVYHIHLKETRAGSMQSTIMGWKQLMGQDLIVVKKHEDVALAITEAIGKFADNFVFENKPQEQNNPENNNSEQTIIL